MTGDAPTLTNVTVKEKKPRCTIRCVIAVAIMGLFGFILGIQGVMWSQSQERYQDALITKRADGIHFDGAVTHESMNKLLNAINTSDTAEPTVWLESGGGDVDAALYFALMVANRPVRTAVGQNAYCASSCVILFLSGRTRYADPTASLALHAAYCFGTLADLECLAEKTFAPDADSYERFMAQRDPEWYQKAVADKAFDYPPERLFCYNFPRGAENTPYSQNESDKTRANCALARALYFNAAMQPEYRQHAQSPIGMFQRLAMIGRWFFGQAGKTARHEYPQ